MFYNIHSYNNIYTWLFVKKKIEEIFLPFSDLGRRISGKFLSNKFRQSNSSLQRPILTSSLIDVHNENNFIYYIIKQTHLYVIVDFKESTTHFTHLHNSATEFLDCCGNLKLLTNKESPWPPGNGFSRALESRFLVPKNEAQYWYFRPMGPFSWDMGNLVSNIVYSVKKWCLFYWMSHRKYLRYENVEEKL